MQQNKHRLVSKRGQKYSLDCQNWTTYHNFLHMYNEMVWAGVAKELEHPVWLNRNGEVCSEEDSFGCKVKYELLHPDNCFVWNEVGGNISMRGDGHVGGRLFLSAPNSVAYDQVSVSGKDPY